jgi:hypothetical protein
MRETSLAPQSPRDAWVDAGGDQPRQHGLPVRAHVGGVDAEPVSAIAGATA